MTFSRNPRRVVQAYRRLDDKPTDENPYPTVASGALAISTAPRSAAAAGLRGAQGLPREDELLGYYKNYYGPWDNAARWLEAIARRAGVPTDTINQWAGLPSADEAAQSRADYIAAREREGVTPGGWGELAGTVVSGLPFLAAEGIPGFLAGTFIGTDRDSAAGQKLDRLFGAERGRKGR